MRGNPSRLLKISFLIAGCLAVATASAAVPIHLGRSGHALTYRLSESWSGYYETNGVAVTLNHGELHLYASIAEPSSPLEWLTLDQHVDGTIELTLGQRNWAAGKESGAPTDPLKYLDFDAALTSDQGQLIAELFEAMDQPQVLCSFHFIQMRDGLEPCLMDGEMLDALQFYLDQLDADDWRQRDWATTMLFDMGEDAAIYLSRLAIDDLTPESAMRVQSILSRYPTKSPG